MRVAIILNTISHVEVAISVYLSLQRISGFDPVLIPIHGDILGLREMLAACQIKADFELSSPPASYQRAIIVTAYPIESEYAPIPYGEHPFVEGFKNNRILITHRCHRSWHFYRGEKVISLAPMSVQRGIPRIYLCENVILDQFEPKRLPRRFLVQGRFESNHRQLDLIMSLSKLDRNDFEVIMLGSGSESALSGNFPFLKRLQDLPELGFYETSATCSFLIPLIDPQTRDGSYMTSRFSSSMLFAFAGLKPVLMHESLVDIYPSVVGKIYKDESEFLDGFCSLLDASWNDIIELRICAEKERNFMRKHNSIILKNMLVRP